MKQRFFVAIVTALVFCAGYLAGLYTEQHRPLPGPPLQFLGEFNRPNGQPDTKSHKPVNRADVVAQVKSLLPMLEDFQRQSQAIDAQFEQDLNPILTPDQRSVQSKELADEQKRHRNKTQRDENRPVTDDELTYLLREQPSRTISNYVVIPFVLDQQTKRYNLDPDQREKVRALLKVRRDRFLGLVDSSPPPSVVLSRLAPLMTRLAQPLPAAPAASAPAP